MPHRNISRILLTWYNFLQSYLKGIPIRLSKQTVLDKMPECFKTHKL